MMKADVESKYEKAAKQHTASSDNQSICLVILCLLFLGGYYVYAKQHRVPTPKFGKLTQPAGRATPVEELSVNHLFGNVARLDQNVRDLKKTIPIFEVDPAGIAAATELQEVTRTLLHRLYGKDEERRYRVHVVLEFQETIVDFAENGKHGEFVIELAPSALQPHSIFTFMELCRHWQKGAFHRIAHHVLQVMVKSQPVIKHLAFQEYSPEYPHRQGTVGYAGRPSGPAWYVSIQDNSRNHGPGSQQKANPHEADSCFGTVVEGWDDIQRITKVKGDGFLGDAKKHVLIKTMTIMVPQADGTYVEWKDEYKEAEQVT